MSNVEDTGPTPLAVLVAALNDEAILTGVEAFCRRIWAPFPAGGETLFAWRMCWAAGIAVPYMPDMDRLIYAAQRADWRVIPATEAPEAGDLAVSARASAPGLTAEFVARPVLRSKDYYGVGAGAARGRRTGAEGQYHSPAGKVLYWLRYYCPECEARRAARALAAGEARANNAH